VKHQFIEQNVYNTTRLYVGKAWITFDDVWTPFRV